ncbi:unnamed protein product, partial [Meganyctiphanes norvegica]
VSRLFPLIPVTRQLPEEITMSIGWSFPLVLSALCVQQSAATCNALYSRGVSSEDINLIVHHHNWYKSRVASGQEGLGAPGPQPTGANMRQLEWDDELARKAQNHADQCIFGHDDRDNRRVSRFSVGQNLYTRSTSNFDSEVEWGRAIKEWYSEVKDFSPNSINPYQFNSGVGHYTQMVWADTYKIGCGYTFYKEGRWHKKLYTCNYGPAGNFLNQDMYRRGSSCSSCPRGTSCSNKYSGLCN